MLIPEHEAQDLLRPLAPMFLRAMTRTNDAMKAMLEAVEEDDPYVRIDVATRTWSSMANDLMSGELEREIHREAPDGILPRRTRGAGVLVIRVSDRIELRLKKLAANGRPAWSKTNVQTRFAYQIMPLAELPEALTNVAAVYEKDIFGKLHRCGFLCPDGKDHHWLYWLDIDEGSAEVVELEVGPVAPPAIRRATPAADVDADSAQG